MVTLDRFAESACSRCHRTSWLVHERRSQRIASRATRLVRVALYELGEGVFAELPVTGATVLRCQVRQLRGGVLRCGTRQNVLQLGQHLCRLSGIVEHPPGVFVERLPVLGPGVQTFDIRVNERTLRTPRRRIHLD